MRPERLLYFFTISPPKPGRLKLNTSTDPASHELQLDQRSCWSTCCEMRSQRSRQSLQSQLCFRDMTWLYITGFSSEEPKKSFWQTNPSTPAHECVITAVDLKSASFTCQTCLRQQAAQRGAHPVPDRGGFLRRGLTDWGAQSEGIELRWGATAKSSYVCCPWATKVWVTRESETNESEREPEAGRERQ